MQKQTFFVEGMTCTGCERAIRNAVTKLEGVQSAEVSLEKRTLVICYSNPCTEKTIAAAVENAGYTIADHAGNRANSVYLLIILLGLYTIALQLGLVNLFQAFPTVSGDNFSFFMLFAVGLLTSVHCIAMCGGMNLAQSLGNESEHPLRRSVLYNLGRLTSYMLIGGVLGFIGEKAAITLQARGIIGLVAGILMLFMGLRMMGVITFKHIRRFRIPAPLAKGISALRRHGAFGIGLANGFMPCGPLQSMQIYAIACGSFWMGAASMFFFCLGTIPLVLFFGTVAGVLKLKWKTLILQIGSGLLVLMGVFTIQNNLALAGISLAFSTSTAYTSDTVVAVVDGNKQYLTTTLHVNGYDDIQVVAGIPVEWTILVENDALNGCNNELVLPFANQQIKLVEGKNIIEFIPEKAGQYTYSCWMGMLRNTITVLEDE